MFLSNDNLCRRWIAAKEAEREAVERRRAIEDTLTYIYGVAEDEEGTLSFEEGSYKVKVTKRISRKVDSDKLQEIAREHGLTDHLSTLFRWTPAINAKTWKSASPDITKYLSEAITATPSRASFAITEENK